MEDKDWIFKKVPNWLRWILTIPIAILFSIILPALARFSMNFAYGNSDSPLINTGVMIASTSGILLGTYLCVPKFKNVITGVVSIILTAYFSIMIVLWAERGYFLTWDNLINLINSIICIYIAVILLSNKDKEE